jgi:hypothetical protein
MIPKKIIVHCTSTKNGAHVDFEAIRQDHIKNRGWDDIGYHILINSDGEVHKGRPLNAIGAHCENENYDSIGICLAGYDKFSKKQLDVLRYQIDGILQVYQIPVYCIYSHRDFDSARKQKKTCPGFESTELLAWYAIQGSKALEDNIL